MKKLIFIVIVLFIAVFHCRAQKAIPAGTAISAVSTFPRGLYYFLNSPKDTTYLNLDTSLSIIRYKHDTITIIKPCPIQRSLKGLSFNPKTNQWIATYQDNSTSIFIPSNTFFIQ